MRVTPRNRNEGMRIIGAEALRISEECGDDMEAARQYTLDWVNEQIRSGDKEPLRSQKEQERCAQEHLRAVVSCLQWAKCAFPQVVVAEKLCAELAAMKMPSECIPYIQMPWDTWVIRVPDNLIWCRGFPTLDDYQDSNHRLENRSIKEIWVFEDWLGGRVHSELGPAYSGKTIYLTVDGTTWGGPRFQIQDWSSLAEELDSMDEQLEGSREAISIAGRIVLGCVAELNNSGINKGTIGKKGIFKREKRGVPKAWTFELRRPVQVDCREWVRAATVGRTKKERRLPTVQTLVRGHWKPRLSERIGRLVSVAPHWRGPKGAPIAVRPHILKG